MNCHILCIQLQYISCVSHTSCGHPQYISHTVTLIYNITCVFTSVDTECSWLWDCRPSFRFKSSTLYRGSTQKNHYSSDIYCQLWTKLLQHGQRLLSHSTKWWHVLRPVIESQKDTSGLGGGELVAVIKVLWTWGDRWRLVWDWNVLQVQ